MSRPAPTQRRERRNAAGRGAALSFTYPDGPRVLESSICGSRRRIRRDHRPERSGKTTLAKHLVGLLQPTAGAVILNGRDRTAMRPAQTAAEVGYVFQNPDHQIFAATVEDEVASGRATSASRRTRFRAAATRCCARSDFRMRAR